MGDWGTISSKTYREHIVPVLESYIGNTGLVVKQDNATGHAAERYFGING